jgi:hypothetical protein
MNPVALARANGYGRIALGLGLLAAPGPLTAGWLGEDAQRPGTQAVARALGARDVLLGFLTAHVAARPGVGARTLATVALVDAVDFAATAAVRDRLPSAGAAGVMALAAASALQLGALAAALR